MDTNGFQGDEPMELTIIMVINIHSHLATWLFNHGLWDTPNRKW
jgi:hypothetical protein